MVMSYGMHLEAGDLNVHIIVRVQRCSGLHLRLRLVQCALHRNMRRPGAIEVLVQRENVEAAEHLVVERRHLPRQPASQRLRGLLQHSILVWSQRSQCLSKH